MFINNYFNSFSRDDWGQLVRNEPTISEMQLACLKYNDIHPKKVKKWSAALKYRALFPTFNLDYDKTINYDSGLDCYQEGPRDWGISFSWDVADLIWNTYEDDVDTRARLNTQIRLDVLDEINRLYFERLRLKKDISDSTLMGDDLFGKKLRLAELTAILDGYSGGYFSKRIKEINDIK